MYNRNVQSLLHILYDIFQSGWIWPLEIVALEMVAPNENKENDNRRKWRKREGKDHVLFKCYNNWFSSFLLKSEPH